MASGSAESAIIHTQVVHGNPSLIPERESTEQLHKFKKEDSKINMPQTYSLVITTSLKTSETARRVARIFSHCIKETFNLKRGKKTLEDVIEFIEKHETRRLMIINQMKNGEVLELKFFRIKKGVAYEEPFRIRMWNIIDHYIYGYQSIPTRAPLSTGLEFARMFPDLTEIMQEYFGLMVNKFGEVWLMGDQTEKETLIQFLDPVKKLPFFSCNLSVRKK